MAASQEVSEYEFISTIRGYHEYKEDYTVGIGDKLFCEYEEGNIYDKNAVKVIINSVKVGHVPRKYSKFFRQFLKRGGSIYGYVVDKWINRGEGLEVPVEYTFKGKTSDIKLLPTLLKPDRV